MKVIILAAGMGVRMSKTHNGPKCLIKLSNETLIQRHLRLLNEFGIKEVVVVIGFEKEKIIENLGHEFRDTKIKYISNEDYTEGNMLSFYAAKDEIDRDIVVMDADIIYDKKIMKSILSTNKPNSLLLDANFPDLGDEYKIIGKDGYIITMDFGLEKPVNGVIGEEVGFTRLTKESANIVLNYAHNFIKKSKTKFSFEDLIKDLIVNGEIKVQYIPIDNLKWTEIDFLEEIERAKKIYSELKE